jgi:hypothetical protein
VARLGRVRRRDRVGTGVALSARAWRSVCGGLVLSVAFAVVATEPVLAGSVSVQTQRISPGSPFSESALCAQEVPGFSRGFAQETSLAVNPRHPRQILVSWIQDGRATDTVMASRDGGRSFSRILVPGLSACTGGAFKVASDPGVDFSADGRMAYFSAIVVNLTSPSAEHVSTASTGMVASRSFDGGFSWSEPYVIQPDTGQFWDLPRLTAHPRRPKRAYYVYDLRRPPDFLHGYSLISTTSNRGRTWSDPRVLYDPQSSDSWPGISKILVNRDGSLLDVMAIVASPPNQATEVRDNPTLQVAIRSVDGGRTWSEPVTIGTSFGRQFYDPVTLTPLNTFDTFPSQTVAPNGDVYVSWAQPGDTTASSRIEVARSTNGGRRWSTRKLAVKGQGALPTIEVAGDGTVGVLYYKIAPESSDGYWGARPWVATSRDHGRHWRRDPVAGRFNLLTAGSNARPCCFLGDYLGIGRLPHGIVAAFSMSKPQAKHNVDAYFTRITTSSPRRSSNAR